MKKGFPYDVIMMSFFAAIRIIINNPYIAQTKFKFYHFRAAAGAGASSSQSGLFIPRA
jgi:hypothetical protein